MTERLHIDVSTRFSIGILTWLKTNSFIIQYVFIFLFQWYPLIGLSLFQQSILSQSISFHSVSFCVFFTHSLLFPLLHFDIHPVAKFHLILSLNRATALSLPYFRFSSNVVVQSLSLVWLFATPWTVAYQAALSFTSLVACSNSCPLSQLCPPTISSSVIPFSSESALCIRWSKYSALSTLNNSALKLQLQHQSFQWIFRTDFQ